MAVILRVGSVRVMARSMAVDRSLLGVGVSVGDWVAVGFRAGVWSAVCVVILLGGGVGAGPAVD